MSEVDYQHALHRAMYEARAAAREIPTGDHWA